MFFVILFFFTAFTLKCYEVLPPYEGTVVNCTDLCSDYTAVAATGKNNACLYFLYFINDLADMNATFFINEADCAFILCRGANDPIECQDVWFSSDVHNGESKYWILHRGYKRQMLWN